MATLNPTRVISVPGRLVIAPTNGGMLAGTYPWGSTQPVGFVEKAKLVRTATYAFANSEARGIDGVSAYRGREKVAFVFVLQQFDTTILNQLWAVNAVSPNGFQGANILSLPQPGRSLAPGRIAPGSQLLYGADDPTKPSFIIYAPIYTHEPKLELAQQLGVAVESVVVLVAGLDAQGRDIGWDKIENLST